MGGRVRVMNHAVFILVVSLMLAAVPAGLAQEVMQEARAATRVAYACGGFYLAGQPACRGEARGELELVCGAVECRLHLAGTTDAAAPHVGVLTLETWAYAACITDGAPCPRAAPLASPCGTRPLDTETRCERVCIGANAGAAACEGDATWDVPLARGACILAWTETRVTNTVLVGHADPNLLYIACRGSDGAVAARALNGDTPDAPER